MLLEIKLPDGPAGSGSVKLGGAELDCLLGVDFSLRPMEHAQVVLTILPEGLRQLVEITKDNPALIQVKYQQPTCAECDCVISRTDNARVWVCGCDEIFLAHKEKV